MKNEADLYNFFAQHKIEFTKHEHNAFFTCEDSEGWDPGQDGAHTKNLFMRNKDRSQYYIVSIEHGKQLHSSSLRKELGEKNLSFASPEEMMDLLGLTPGTVNPFALIRDRAKDVVLIYDEDILKQPGVFHHPLRNTASLFLSSKDIQTFLNAISNKVIIRSIPVKETPPQS